jgi:Uma2 family endonuclease
MPLASLPTSPHQTIANLLRDLGDVPPQRVRLQPFSGTATENDVLHSLDHEDRVYELIDKTLVEKSGGILQSFFISALIQHIGHFISSRKLGVLSNGQGPFRMNNGNVRFPDVAYVEWNRIPCAIKDLPPIAPFIPNLAIEVLSESNTQAEIQRKLNEYFSSGVELVWIFDLGTKTVAVQFSAGPPSHILTHVDTLDGGTVLRGFELKLADLFAELERSRPS